MRPASRCAAACRRPRTTFPMRTSKITSCNGRRSCRSARGRRSGRGSSSLEEPERSSKPGLLRALRLVLWVALLRARTVALMISRAAGRAARQGHDDFGKTVGLGQNIDPATVLLDHDVVAHRQAEAGAFAGRFCGE